MTLIVQFSLPSYYSLSTVFLKTISLCAPSLSVAGKVSNLCKTDSKIIVLYTLIFIFLDGKWEDKTYSELHVSTYLDIVTLVKLS